MLHKTYIILDYQGLAPIINESIYVIFFICICQKDKQLVLIIDMHVMPAPITLNACFFNSLFSPLCQIAPHFIIINHAHILNSLILITILEHRTRVSEKDTATTLIILEHYGERVSEKNSDFNSITGKEETRKIQTFHR